MTSSSYQAECWMTVLQIGAEAILFSSEWYCFTCALNSPALIWQDRREAAETREAGDIAYLVISDLANVKCKLIGEEMIVLCCEMECSSALVQILFWMCFTSPHWGTWHYVCQLLSFPANLLTGSDRMCTCLAQPHRGWSQTGSEHSVCLRGLEKWLEDFSSNKWIDYLPLLLIQKQVMLAKR